MGTTTLIDQVRQAGEAERAAALTAYRSLLSRSGKPRNGDVESLRRVMTVLNIDASRLQADQDVLKQAVELVAVAAGDTPELAERIEAAGQQWSDFQAETKAIIETRRQGEVKLSIAFNELQQRRNAAHDARRKLRGLKQTHYQLFDVEPPQREEMRRPQLAPPQDLPNPVAIEDENKRLREMPWVPMGPGGTRIGEREASEAASRMDEWPPRPQKADQVDVTEDTPGA